MHWVLSEDKAGALACFLKSTIFGMWELGTTGMWGSVLEKQTPRDGCLNQGAWQGSSASVRQCWTTFPVEMQWCKASCKTSTRFLGNNFASRNNLVWHCCRDKHLTEALYFCAVNASCGSYWELKPTNLGWKQFPAIYVEDFLVGHRLYFKKVDSI